MRIYRSIFLVIFVFLVLVSPKPVAAFGGSTTLITKTKNTLTRFWLSLPGKKSGRLVLSQTVFAEKTTSSMGHTAEVSFDFMNESDSILKVKLTSQGDVAWKKDENQGNMLAPSISGAHESWNLMVDGDHFTQNANGELVQTKDGVFVQAAQLPTIPFMKTAKVTNTWIKLNPDLWMEKAVDDSSSEELKQKQEVWSKAVAELWRDAHVNSATKQDKNGVPVFEVTVEFPSQAVVRFVQEISGNTNQIKNDVVRGTTAKLWIDRRTYELQAAEVVSEMQLSDLGSPEPVINVEEVVPSIGQATKVKATLSFAVTSRNTPVSVQTPEAFLSADEVIKNVFELPNVESLPTPPASDADGKTGPIQLPTLTPEEQELLKQYGVDVDFP